MKEYNFPITECPECGGGNIEIRQKITGYGTYYVDLKTGEIEASSLHDNLNYKNTRKYAVCADCGKKLFKVDNDLNVVRGPRCSSCVYDGRCNILDAPEYCGYRIENYDKSESGIFDAIEDSFRDSASESDKHGGFRW